MVNTTSISAFSYRYQNSRILLQTSIISSGKLDRSFSMGHSLTPLTMPTVSTAFSMPNGLQLLHSRHSAPSIPFPMLPLMSDLQNFDAPTWVMFLPQNQRDLVILQCAFAVRVLTSFSTTQSQSLLLLMANHYSAFIEIINLSLPRLARQFAYLSTCHGDALHHVMEVNGFMSVHYAEEIILRSPHIPIVAE